MVKKKATESAKQESNPKQELEVYCGENWELVHNGLEVKLISATGFYVDNPDKYEGVDRKLRITVEEI